MYNSGMLILDSNLTKLHVTLKLFHLDKLVSSERVIMYLFIAAFNTISNVVW